MGYENIAIDPIQFYCILSVKMLRSVPFVDYTYGTRRLWHIVFSYCTSVAPVSAPFVSPSLTWPANAMMNIFTTLRTISNTAAKNRRTFGLHQHEASSLSKQPPFLLGWPVEPSSISKVERNCRKLKKIKQQWDWIPILYWQKWHRLRQ